MSKKNWKRVRDDDLLRERGIAYDSFDGSGGLRKREADGAEKPRKTREELEKLRKVGKAKKAAKKAARTSTPRKKARPKRQTPKSQPVKPTEVKRKAEKKAPAKQKSANVPATRGGTNTSKPKAAAKPAATGKSGASSRPEPAERPTVGYWTWVSDWPEGSRPTGRRLPPGKHELPRGAVLLGVSADGGLHWPPRVLGMPRQRFQKMAIDHARTREQLLAHLKKHGQWFAHGAPLATQALLALLRQPSVPFTVAPAVHAAPGRRARRPSVKESGD